MQLFLSIYFLVNLFNLIPLFSLVFRWNLETLKNLLSNQKNKVGVGNSITCFWLLWEYLYATKNTIIRHSQSIQAAKTKIP